MRQFDVYQFDSAQVPLVVDVQAEVLSGVSTRVVIPLVDADTYREEATMPIKPVIDIDSREYLLMTTDMSAQPVRSLGKVVANIEDEHRDTIVRALDFLLFGF